MTRFVHAAIHLALHQLEHAPLATSRGTHAGRPTLLLGLDLTSAGTTSEVWAEACPLPGFGEGGDHLDLARDELMALDEGDLSSWLAKAPLDALAAAFEAGAELRSAAARHAIEWVVIEGAARLAGTRPTELLHAWLGQRSSVNSWPGPRQVVSASQVLDLCDPELLQQALRLAERGIGTWKLKCGRSRAKEERALEELARLDLPARLRLDPGCVWNASEAGDFVRGMQSLCQASRLRLEFVEDPTPNPEEWSELAELCPLAADEVLAKEAALAPAAAHASFWVLKPMALGIGRVLEFAGSGAERDRRLVISHAFDGPLALLAASELACLVQGHDHAAGLGPHRGLNAWGAVPSPSGKLLRGQRLGPARLGSEVLLDGGHLARVLFPRPSLREPGAEADTPGDALSLSRAAALYPERTFLDLDDRALTFTDLEALERADQGGSLTAAFVPIVAEATPASILSLLRALESGLPALLLHPSSTDEARRLTIERCQRQSAELMAGDAVIVPTSGSTALPHLALHTRASLLAAVSASAARLGGPGPDTRWLLSLPFAHVGGLSILLRCLAAGACVVVSALPRAPADVQRLLGERRVTHLSVVPTQLRRWLDDPAFRFPASVECVLVGGAHAPASLRAAARDRGAPVLFTYGLTEMASQVATEAPHGQRGERRSGVGQPLVGVEIAVSSAGCLCVGGPMLMRTYLGEPTPSEGGLFLTSDLAQLDDESGLTIHGRQDDTIISGGENVAPQAIEAALSEVPGVLELCVLGQDSAEWGQAVVAVIVPRGDLDRDALARDLKEAARSRLAAFACPKAYRFVEGLPRLDSGKIDRRRLLAQLLPVKIE